MNNKETPEIKERILNAVREHNPSIRKLAESVGVTHTSVCTWLKKDEQFADDFREARKAHIDALQPIAQSSLKKLAEGFKRTKVVTKVDESGTIFETTTTVEEVAPSLEACKFIVIKSDPKNYE